jgi:hypothetical protein
MRHAGHQLDIPGVCSGDCVATRDIMHRVLGMQRCCIHPLYTLRVTCEIIIFPVILYGCDTQPESTTRIAGARKHVITICNFS